MIVLIGKALFWMVFATVIACIEIESEGEYGWAEKAPTWFRTTGIIAKLYGMIMGKKPLTGYHSFMFFFPLMLFHAHFVGIVGARVPWTMTGELLAWAMYFAWCILWDFQWFVLNPFYAGRFTKKDIWWHAQSPWVFGLFPLDYMVGVGASILFASAATWWSHNQAVLIEHIGLLVGFAIYTIALKLASPLYRKWYWKMRETDDRSKAPIFHRERDAA